jgi:hypothetical protein
MRAFHLFSPLLPLPLLALFFFLFLLLTLKVCLQRCLFLFREELLEV